MAKWLVTNYDVIVIDDLKVKNLMKNHKLARIIANVCWYKLAQTIEYECQWYSENIQVGFVNIRVPFFSI